MQMIKVLFLASEADPLVKVGGLGDVAGSLPPALHRLVAQKSGGATIDIRLVLPFHSAIRHKHPDVEYLCEFEVPTRAGSITAQAYQLSVNGIPTYLIAGAPIGEDAPVYDRDAAVDGHKFFFFSLAALELVKKLTWQPDILHTNDWPTAIAGYALKVKRPLDPFYRNMRSVHTIHNLLFMGAGSEPAFDTFDLPPSQAPGLPRWATRLPLPVGLGAADRIVAVSTTYAQEILTPEYGSGLEEFLNTRREVISGIVNGIDVESWNPAIDPHIPVNFDATTLARRQHNKAELIQEFTLNLDPKIPLIILITRMDHQKGVDLAIEALAQTVGESWQAILLGTGDPQLEDASRQLERAYPERVRTAIRFDTRLSRRMYAGADIFLMPSRYEPCGLAQMMALRYGCVPVAHATGGLKDTIIDFADSAEQGTGFLFEAATSGALAEMLLRALAVYPDRARWGTIQRNGMSQDFSWENSAIKYAAVYQDLIKRHT